MRFLFLPPIVMLLLLLSGCASPLTTQVPAPSETDTDTYRINPEDVLDIVVWKNPDVSRTVPVRPDGMISLPLLNDVQAAGLTPMQLREVLIKGLAEYIPNAEVSVIVSRVNSFRVTVIGEVARPGHFDLPSRTTVLEALGMAGGFGEFARRSHIVILRRESEGVQRIPFDYNEAVNGNGNTLNFFLQPGDIILVP